MAPELIRVRRLAAPGLYLALGLLVAGPLLGGGLLLAVDFALPAHPHLAPDYWGVPAGTHGGLTSRLPLDALLVALGEVGLVPAAEHALVVAIVFLAGWGMHRAAPGREPARFFAGLLYAVNPFVYDRLYTGQLFLLLGYALLPHAWLALVKALTGRLALVAPFAAWAVAVGIASAHMAVLLVVLVALTAIMVSVGSRSWTPIGRAAAGLGLAALPSLYWLVPTPGLSDLWAHIGRQQLAYYATVGQGRWGVPLTVAGLSGYWNDPEPIVSFLPFWPLLALTLVALASLALVLRHRDPLVRAAAAAGGLGFLLALGYASPVTRGTFVFLAEHVGVVRSFRESQKGVVLLVFAYALLGATGVEELLGGLRGRWRVLAAAAVLALPVVYGFRAYGALWGRLETSAYPASWAQAKATLAREAPASRTLFLPWGAYLELDFAHFRLVRNPAAEYFSTPVLAARSAGGEGGVTDNSDPEDAKVARLLADPGRPGLARCLASLGVSHVLVARQVGAARFPPAFDRRRDFVAVDRWDDLVLYRIVPAGGLVMTGSGSDCSSRLRPVAARYEDPAHVRLLEPAAGPLTLGLPQPGRWQRRGEELVHADWSAYRRNYALGGAGTAAAVMLTLGAALRSRRRR